MLLEDGRVVQFGSHEDVPPLLRSHYGQITQVMSGTDDRGRIRYRVLLLDLGFSYAEARDGEFTILAPDAEARLKLYSEGGARAFCRGSPRPYR